MRVIPAASMELEQLLNLWLPALWQSVIGLEKFKAYANRVDGLIIGTGAADFTKGNIVYTLHYKDKTFQLIDVPGIEGDEGKYKDIVREAVAKAHMVFYVNGTNKKPEKATAEKIRSYLRNGTQVCPLINVRGNADAYEFEEDRETLESKDVLYALQQTQGVLEAVLGEKVLLPALPVQGLLSFSALAMHAPSGRTTIHHTRDVDLVIQQRNFLKHFSSPKAAYEFSRISRVARVLHDKHTTFKTHIIESNKVKVKELLEKTLADLEIAKGEHHAFMEKVKPEFQKCRESIEDALQAFERMITAGRKNLWNEFFNELIEEADKIIDENYGDKERISQEIERAFKNRQNEMSARLQQQFEEHVADMQNSLGESLERLIQDVRRFEFLQQISLGQGGARPVYQGTDLDIGLSLKELGSIALSVGSYALLGAGIGSSFPGIGNLIGAIAGAIVGLLMSVVSMFTSREKHIRKAQAKVLEKIEEARDDVLSGLSNEVKGLMQMVREEVKNSVLDQVDLLHEKLSRPLRIIEHQIALMTRIKNQLEKMPYGTIQAIQH